MIYEMSNLVTDLCEFVCEYLAWISARIALNISHIRMGVRQCGYADGCPNMAYDKMMLGTKNIGTVDFQLLSSKSFVCTCLFLCVHFIKICLCDGWNEGREGDQRAHEWVNFIVVVVFWFLF